MAVLGWVGRSGKCHSKGKNGSSRKDAVAYCAQGGCLDLAHGKNFRETAAAAALPSRALLLPLRLLFLLPPLLPLSLLLLPGRQLALHPAGLPDGPHLHSRHGVESARHGHRAAAAFAAARRNKQAAVALTRQPGQQRCQAGAPCLLACISACPTTAEPATQT